jgi:hypothetical protein
MIRESQTASSFSNIGQKARLAAGIAVIAVGVGVVLLCPLPLRVLVPLLAFGAVTGILWSSGYEVPAAIAAIAIFLFTDPSRGAFQ